MNKQIFSFYCFPLFSFQDDQQYFRFQFQDDSNPFRNLSELGLWRDDGVFTDQRLAGGNPMAIKRVSWDAGNRVTRPPIKKTCARV